MTAPGEAGLSFAGSGAGTAGAAGAAGAAGFNPAYIDPFGGLPYGEAAGAAGAAGAGTAATTAAQSLAQILKSGGTVDDWLKVAGTAAPGLIAAYASSQQGNAIKDLASQQKSQFDEFKGFGAPYRDRLAGLYADPSSFLSSQEVQGPVQQGTNALARSLSAQVGNPIGNMSALGELQNYSANQLFGRLGQEKDRLGGFGGLSAYNQAAAGGPSNTQLALSGIGADSGIWGGIGRAAGDVFNPGMTLAEFLKQMQGNNMFTVK